MQSITLRMSNIVRHAGPAVVMAATGVVLLCPVQWPWRLASAGLVLGSGAILWKRYLSQRPRRLSLDAKGGLEAGFADGRLRQVVAIEPGIVRPWLISARLHHADGSRSELLVSARCIAEEEHWRLRRWLVGFRPRDTRADPDAAQSTGRRGT